MFSIAYLSSIQLFICLSLPLPAPNATEKFGDTTLADLLSLPAPNATEKFGDTTLADLSPLPAPNATQKKFGDTTLADLFSINWPFNNMSKLSSPSSEKGSNRASSKADQTPRIAVNLPFSQMKIPAERSGLDSVVNDVLNRPLFRINKAKLPKSADDNDTVNAHRPEGLEQLLEARAFLKERTDPPMPSEPTPAPWAVINLPFSDLKLPFANMQTKKLDLPPQTEYLTRELQPKNRDIGEKVNSGGRSVSSSIPFDEQKLFNMIPLPNTEGMRGNLDNLNDTGPNTNLTFRNKLYMPWSVMNLPYNTFQMPFSQFMMPFSHAGSTVDNLQDIKRPGGPEGQALLLQALQNMQRQRSGSVDTGLERSLMDSAAPAAAGPLPLVETVPSAHGLPVITGHHKAPGEAELQDAVAAADAARVPELPFNINDFQLPYSFLNTPLAFMTTPFSFVDLPFNSFNLPFAHLNLPTSNIAASLADQFQTFGVPPVVAPPIVPSLDFSPISSPIQASLEGMGMAMSGRSANALPKVDMSPDAILQNVLNKIFPSGLSGAAKLDDEERSKSANRIQQFLSNTLFKALQPGALPQTDGNNSGNAVSDTLKEFQDAFRTVPGIPNMQGLFETPYSLFLTPNALFNLPLGFMDEPLGYMNLPLSHFNLPLSHMLLPFAGMGMPLEDIELPYAPTGTLQDASLVNSPDIPPSMLEYVNPDNPLTSYLNMPLTEMNMPFGVFDMPFTIFDMPFGFNNMPLSNLVNPLAHLHLPFQQSALPFAEAPLPFANLIAMGQGRSVPARKR